MKKIVITYLIVLLCAFTLNAQNEKTFSLTYPRHEIGVEYGLGYHPVLNTSNHPSDHHNFFRTSPDYCWTPDTFAGWFSYSQEEVPTGRDSSQKINNNTLQYKHSIGLSLGMFNGISLKNNLVSNVYLQTDIGFSYIGMPFSLIMTSEPLLGYLDIGARLGFIYEKSFLKHKNSFWFLGGGFDFGKDIIDDSAPYGFSSLYPLKVGAHAIVGFEWTFNIPLSLQLDIRPGYGVLFASNKFVHSNDWFVITKFPCHFFDFTVAFSIRYLFGNTTNLHE